MKPSFPLLCAYSNRMYAHNHDKYDDALAAADGRFNKPLSETLFPWSDWSIVAIFLRSYYNDDTIEVVNVVPMDIQSIGYPVWYMSWTSSKQKE